MEYCLFYLRGAPFSRLFRGDSSRFSSPGDRFIQQAKRLGVFMFFSTFLTIFKKKTCFWCVFRFNSKTNGFLMILSFPRVGKSQFFSFSNFNIKTNGFLMMILNQ